MHRILSPLSFALALSAVGMAGTPQKAANLPTVQKEFSGRQLDAPVLLFNDTVGVLKLPAVSSSGYRWEVLNQEDILPVLEHHHARDSRGRFIPEFESKADGAFQPGGTRQQLMRFTGKAKGETKLTLVYRRPWEAGYKDIKQVTVKSAGAFQGTAPVREAARAYVPPTQESVAAGALPSRWDWREHNGVTSVKDQGQCGSCWTFGTTAVMESKILIKTGVVKDYAEEYLVRCGTQAGQGCNGGWWGYNYYWNLAPVGEIGAGARLESEMPYTASDGPCGSPHTPYEQIEGWAYTDGVSDTAWPQIDHNPTVAQIKQAIYDYGPIGTALDASNWGNYTGGVWKETGSTTTDHIVTIVGWDDADGAFIIKNSWGPTWGESGYMRLAYGSDLVGNCSTYVLRETTSPEIVLRSNSFVEGKANNGSFDAPVYLYLTNQTSSTQFAVTSGEMTLGKHFTVANLPAGLTAHVTATGATTAQVTLTGQASAHAAANSLSTLQLTFLDAAFTGGSAAAVKNAASTLGLTFHDPYQFVHTTLATPMVTSPSNVWTTNYLDNSNYGLQFGIWFTGTNAAWPQDPNQNSLKLEIYGNQGICTGTTMPGQLIPLASGTVIGPNAQSWCNCGTYGDQLSIARPDYLSWAGKTSYAGFTFNFQGYPVYGWFKIQVSSDGRTATLTEYAWDQDPNHTIKAGQTTADTTTTPSVAVTSPATGAQWVQGATNAITWTASNFTNAKVELLKAGVVNTTLTSSVPAANGTFSWKVPATQTLGSDYAVRVSCIDSGKTATSTSGTFSVVAAAQAPTIITQPVSQTVNVGQTATFTVAASGTAPFTYQWQKNNANISGATAASYTTPAAAATDNGATFRCVVTNSVASTPSNAATLTVNPTPVNTVKASITAPAADVTVTTGSSVAFTGTATDSSPTATLSYAWDFGDGTTATGTSASHAFTNTGTAALTRTVTLTATDNTGAKGTATRKVTVNPTSGTLSLNLQVVPGTNSATFNPNTTGASSVVYWLDSQAAVTKTASPFTYTATGLATGSHSVYARAYDAAGNYKDSGWVTFTLQGLSLNLQVAVSGTTATFNPNATGAAKVTYWVDSLAAVTKTTAPFTHSLSGLSKGTHQVYARAYDAAGGYKDSSWVSFTIK